MVEKKDLKRKDTYLYEVPTTYREDMRVPARLYADEQLLEAALSDRSVEQLVNTTTLPGVVKYTLAMPDIHQGYGFPIGGVAATRPPDGVISPGGIGYDINCGVRVLASDIERKAVAPYIDDLLRAMYSLVPTGLGKGGIKISKRDLDKVLERGAAWAAAAGYGTQDDLERTEESGCLAGADASKVSQRAKDRGLQQLGSLGSGNHFLEIDEIVEVYDEEVARVFGLRQGCIAVQVHCGSRGLGHQVCTDYVSSLQKSIRKFGIELPDRELVCAPFESSEGQDYFAAMAASANFAWTNRHVIAHWVRDAFEQVLAGKVGSWELRQVYDVAHNIGKVERYSIDGKEVRLVIHRKGATRAFGPSAHDLPQAYRGVGQPVLVPGSMGTASYILVGTDKALELTFGSCCHGAGRVMSRSQAKKKVWGEDLLRELKEKGIAVQAGSMAGLAEEAPQAYKDVERVVDVVEGAGIARKVARLVPLGVIKG
ncbi:MAG TPA: RtcB family protein [Anaerolineae bacterium]|nr:RtcB family protein [Anaerolineae bacterium]